jgi:hypothetical protein
LAADADDQLAFADLRQAKAAIERGAWHPR